MTDRIPQIKPQELIKILEKSGFVIRRQSGSHIIMRNSLTKNIAIVPVHAKDIKRGLLFGILKQANISQKEFWRMLR